MREEEDAEGRAEDRAAGGTDDVGIGQGVAEEALKEESGDGERGADQGGGEDAGEAELEEDGVLGWGERVATQKCAGEGRGGDVDGAYGE